MKTVKPLTWARRRARQFVRFWRLPPEGRDAVRRDRRPLPAPPDIDATVEALAAWIGRAQDESASADGGVASYYSLTTGWATSYPETTGYIAPTMLEYARRRKDDGARTRAKRMIDWLVSIQLPGGGFQGGTIGATPIVPVTFNTGQILFALAAGGGEWGEEYEGSLRAAADWLVRTQDPDGCWRAHPSPFTEQGEKSYETHVAWALVEAERVCPGHGYYEAALANVRWAISQQHANGWYAKCGLHDPDAPLTHTIGYALRGCLEVFRFGSEPELLDAATRAADGLLSALGPGGWLAGRVDRHWRGTVDWVCVTGTAQIASCWFILYDLTRKREYLDAARSANAFVRRTIRLDGPSGVQGGVKGSHPVDGGYCPYWYLNWAAKFALDAHFHEIDHAT